jgi:hypothetical protein
VIQIGKHEVSMRQMALITGAVTLLAFGSATMLRLLIPATSLAAPSQAAQIPTDERQSQVDAGPFPVLRIENLF